MMKRFLLEKAWLSKKGEFSFGNSYLLKIELFSSLVKIFITLSFQFTSHYSLEQETS